MERPTKKLWRKIGLQKNFLEGTSHSDESKNTLSQFQQSFIKSQCSRSNQPQAIEVFRTQLNKVKYQGELLKDLMNVQKQLTFEQGSCQTPINKLNMSNYEDGDMIWQVADDTIDLINDNKQSGSNLSQSGKQSLLHFESLRMKQQKQQLSIRNITQTVPHSVNRQREYENEDKIAFKQDQNQVNQVNDRKTSINSMKIILHGVEQKQSQTNESQYARNIRKSYHNRQQTSVEQIYKLEIDAKELQKQQKVQNRLNKLKSLSVPKLHQILGQFRKSFGSQKYIILQQMIQMRQVMTQFIKNQVSQQMQQLSDQIGYLYSQNGELMTKIQEKQSVIKKHHQEYTKLQQKLSQYTQSIRAQYQHKQCKIVQLQNQVNKLQEKLQDFQDLQTKIQSEQNKNQQLQTINRQLQTKNCQLQSTKQQLQTKTQQLQTIKQQLQSQMSIFISNQRNFNHLMDQKTFDLSAAIIKNQQLQWQINQLYNKNQQLQYNLKKENQKNIQTLQTQHFTRLNLQKSFLEKQKSKNNKSQILLETLTHILVESLKHVSLNLIEAIYKQFNMERNHYLDQIFSKAISQAQSSSRAYSLNKDTRHSNQQSNQHSPKSPRSPRSQSENGNSSNKNLRRTGYFGEVTKPTLTIRLDDIQKKFSTQIPQDDENPNHFYNSRLQSIPQKKTLFRGDTFSQISQEGSVRQDYVYRTVQPSYPRNQQRKWSKQKHSRHDSPHMKHYGLNESIKQDLHRVKLSLKQQNIQKSSREFPDHINNYQMSHNQQLTNENVNYSFSEMNWNAYDINDDRSSVTTYEKSQNNYNREQERYMPKNGGNYYRAPTDRSEKSQKSQNSSSQRQDIIQKIKERVRLKLKSKDKYKYENTHNEPTYTTHVETSIRKPSYHESEYEQTPKLIKKDDNILADFYQRHSIKNPIVTQHQAQRKMSPIPASRSPSNTRSRSPSSSSTSRVTAQNTRIGTTKYTPIIGTATYGAGNQAKTPSSITSRNTFSKSMVQRPQFTAYSKKTNQPNPTATYQPKSTLYSINRGETQTGSTYGKKY